jgi:uncharacterized membrane protein YsdA (DUF1294 family)
MQYVLMAYAAMSVATLAAFCLDKRAARRGGARIPETTLHVMELLGGFPGALLGQQVFRHKTSKGSYVFALWVIIAVHALAWVLYLRS